MAKKKTSFELVRHPLKVRTLSVARVEDIGPRMRRVVLSGSELAGFTSLAPEDHVKVFFPRPGEARPVLPVLGPLGLPLPTLGERPIGRDYTPRHYDAERGELTLDFYLHGRGVAARWAETAAAGQLLGVAGPRGSYVLTREFAWHLFVGDETGLPEFARRIEELAPPARALTLVVVDGAACELPFTGASAITSHWVHRPAGGDAAQLLVSTLASLALPEGEGFAWLAGEATEMGEVYRHLVGRGFPQERVHVSGHWKRGVPNHDHHEPVALEAP